MNALVKQAAGLMPEWMQLAAKRIQCGSQIKWGRFKSEEPEFEILPELLIEGCWALDIGANIGHYTLKMAGLVGASGRVIAIEPEPWNFAILSENVARLTDKNVTLIQAAASDRLHVTCLDTPRENGRPNRYQSRIRDGMVASLHPNTIGVPIDDLYQFPRLDLVKIDVEGHEPRVIRGMQRTLEAHHPALIVENGESAGEVGAMLGRLGYKPEPVRRGSPQPGVSMKFVMALNLFIIGIAVGIHGGQEYADDQILAVASPTFRIPEHRVKSFCKAYREGRGAPMSPYLMLTTDGIENEIKHWEAIGYVEH